MFIVFTSGHKAVVGAAVFVFAALIPTGAWAEAENPDSRSAEERALTTHWAGIQERLRGEIGGLLPLADEGAAAGFSDSIAAYEAARNARAEARRMTTELTRYRGLVWHARNKWIGGAETKMAEARQRLSEATTEEETEAAENELLKWNENKEQGISALKERQAALDEARRLHPARVEALAETERAFGRAEAAVIAWLLPQADQKAIADFYDSIATLDAAREAVKVARDAAGNVGRYRGLVQHARTKWIAGADKNINAARQRLRNATTTEETEAAREELLKGMENKELGIAALVERMAALEEARLQEPARLEALAEAERAFERTEDGLIDGIHRLGAGDALKSDRLDALLATYSVIHRATPEGLARFSLKQDGNRELLERLFDNHALLIEMEVADGARNGRYGDAMRIYESILDHEESARLAPHLRRLALAIALEHAEPIHHHNPDKTAPRVMVDPIKRFFHYKHAEARGELDKAFSAPSVWEYRFLVDATEPDEILQWGRDMLRNYRPDLLADSCEKWRYVRMVRTDVAWGSAFRDHHRDDLQIVQNTFISGGTCGPRALVGRFMLRAFGIPTIARPQHRHASLARRTPAGWAICLGGTWGTGWTHMSYGSDLNFLASTRVRSLGDAHHMQVMRAHWIGTIMGEPRVWQMDRAKPGFWNAVALHTQRHLIDQHHKPLQAASHGDDTYDDFGGGGGETGAEPAAFTPSDQDRQVTIASNGVITIPAAAIRHPQQGTRKIQIMESHLGGSQMHYAREGDTQDFEYHVDLDAPGEYNLSAKVVTLSWGQGLALSLNGVNAPLIELPNTIGSWDTSRPVAISLVEGRNFLRFTPASEGFEKGLTIKEFTLTPK